MESEVNVGSIFSFTVPRNDDAQSKIRSPRVWQCAWVVLAPVGTALLGMSVGQHIDWPAPGGKMIKLTLLAIEYQPEAAGDPF